MPPNKPLERTRSTSLEVPQRHGAPLSVSVDTKPRDGDDRRWQGIS
jgi:hypothetical protein